jgi:hypothetical protein
MYSKEFILASKGHFQRHHVHEESKEEGIKIFIARLLTMQYPGQRCFTGPQERVSRKYFSGIRFKNRG